MRLREALQIAGRPAGARLLDVHLLCGCVPLHLETFVNAHLRLRVPDARVSIRSGLFGDLEGNLDRAMGTGGHGAIVVLEWSDLDPRLGLRASAGYRQETLDDVVSQTAERCARLEQHLMGLAGQGPVALAGPTLPLAPLTAQPPSTASHLELRLNAIVAEFLARLSERDGIRVVSASALGSASPVDGRLDVRTELSVGYPYTLTHTDALARLCVASLYPDTPRKGLITDLDETLWRGILGEVGADGVSWSLEGKSQAHALYQQTLASLAESGVLLAVASKNDGELVAAALRRPDLLVPPAQLFPIEASWGPKSDAVKRILDLWNVGADSVVFVDDSPMELAEVADAIPGIECLRFPTGDAAAVVDLLRQLRARFGKHAVLPEDRLRSQSIRAASAGVADAPERRTADFLSTLDARVTFEAAGHDQRAFELANKTNQFNLNGLRYTEGEWRALALRAGAFMTTVSYEDRFGPLGRISVLGGVLTGRICCVDMWVLSCRAFSRQVEFQSVLHLFQQTGVSEIRFRLIATARNAPVQAFFANVLTEPLTQAGEVALHRDQFERRCPPLYHQVHSTWTPTKPN